MICARHGEVEYLYSNSFASEPAVHTLSCGCSGTAEQLRDPDWKPPSQVLAEAENALAEAAAAAQESAKVAEDALAAKHEELVAAQAAHAEEVAAHVDTIADKDAEIAFLKEQLAQATAPVEPPAATPAAIAHADAVGVDLTQVEGTGVDGTITKPDVVAAANQVPEDTNANSNG